MPLENKIKRGQRLRLTSFYHIGKAIEIMKIYAAYGSNMHLEQMKKRCPKAKVIGKGDWATSLPFVADKAVWRTLSEQPKACTNCVMVKQYEDMPALPNEHYFEIIRQGYRDNEIHTAPLIEALKFTRDEIVNQ